MKTILFFSILMFSSFICEANIVNFREYYLNTINILKNERNDIDFKMYLLWSGSDPNSEDFDLNKEPDPKTFEFQMAYLWGKFDAYNDLIEKFDFIKDIESGPVMD